MDKLPINAHERVEKSSSGALYHLDGNCSDSMQPCLCIVRTGSHPQRQCMQRYTDQDTLAPLLLLNPELDASDMEGYQGLIGVFSNRSIKPIYFRWALTAWPIASRTSGSALMVLFTSHSLTLPLSSFVPCSSPTNGAMSNASSLLDSTSLALAVPSSLANCCRSCWEAVAAGAGFPCGKRLPSWEKAMKRVNVALRARTRSWKGNSGGWSVSLLSIGLNTLVSSGEG